jgi:flagellar hook assembly protein FlgD
MAKVSEHTTRPSASLAIYYNATLQFNEDEITLGAPYPNPFTSQVTIPFGFVNEEDTSEVMMSVYDIGGKEVARVTGQSTTPGLRSIRWNGCTNDGSPLPAGLYLYHVVENKASGVVITKGKLIKQG